MSPSLTSGGPENLNPEDFQGGGLMLGSHVRSSPPLPSISAKSQEKKKKDFCSYWNLSVLRGKASCSLPLGAHATCSLFLEGSLTPSHPSVPSENMDVSERPSPVPSPHQIRSLC